MSQFRTDTILIPRRPTCHSSFVVLEEHHNSNSRGAAPLFMNNVAGLWDNDTIKDHQQDGIDGNNGVIGAIHRRSSAIGSTTNPSRPTSSLILDDDATPPLPWKEPASQFAATDRLSASRRFSMDALADVGGKYRKSCCSQHVRVRVIMMNRC